MTTWLSDDEQRMWRTWLAVTTRLPAALNRQLQGAAGLTLAEYDVLVALSESTDHRLRVAALAGDLGWERSRVSHQVTRMVARGLVEKEECDDDGRGAWVVLTSAGRSAIADAAPEHVGEVRRVVFDGLSADELAVLDRVWARWLDRV